jgi:hypothetical protein
LCPIAEVSETQLLLSVEDVEGLGHEHKVPAVEEAVKDGQILLASQIDQH